MNASSGLIVSPDRSVVRRRRLPVSGEVLVTEGATVRAEDIVARAMLEGPLLPVPVAGLLGCEPAGVARLLTVTEGMAVREGDVLGRSLGIWRFGAREARAPMAGTVERVSPTTGQITLRGASRALEVRAHLPGVVSAVSPGEGADIICRAAQVQGVFGIGGETRGILSTEALPGAVWLLRTADSDDLRRAADAGVAAVVAGGIGYADLGVVHSRRSPVVVVLTEGFGDQPMADRTWNILRVHLGRAAAVDGTTQIRAGVVRPDVVIPRSGEGRPLPSGPPPELRLGIRVRIVREPGLGRCGRVLQLPPLPRTVDSGVVTRVVLVALDGGGVQTVPRANVEVES